jgi:hypothetical protein
LLSLVVAVELLNMVLAVVVVVLGHLLDKQ